MILPALAGLMVLLPLFGAAVRSSGHASPHAEAAESARLFHEGLRRYAEGDAGAALALFREVARREPGHLEALAAVRRLEAEAARPSPKPAAPAPRPSSAERFFLGTLPRWYYFERTVGDGLRDVGALRALNARIEQLLGERRASIARDRPFRKERQLRELLRRAPLAAASAYAV